MRLAPGERVVAIAVVHVARLCAIGDFPGSCENRAPGGDVPRHEHEAAVLIGGKVVAYGRPAARYQLGEPRFGSQGSAGGPIVTRGRRRGERARRLARELPLALTAPEPLLLSRARFRVRGDPGWIRGCLQVGGVGEKMSFGPEGGRKRIRSRRSSRARSCLEVERDARHDDPLVTDQDPP